MTRSLQPNARPTPQRPHKYHARRTYYQGEAYPSRGEAAYARHLDLLKAAGTIHDWRRGREWVLLDAPRRRDRIVYVPDFEVWPTPEQFELREFKGAMTPSFRLKAKLFKARYPDVPLVVVWADGSEVRL